MKVKENYFIELEKREKAEASQRDFDDRRKKATADLKDRFDEIATESMQMKEKMMNNEDEASKQARKEEEMERLYKLEKKRLKSEKKKKKAAKDVEKEQKAEEARK